MRLDAARIAIALCLLTGAIAAQEVLPPPQLPPSAKLTDHINAREEYYSRIGNVKGTGFRPYTRQLEFVKPRSYPSGDMVNLTALTWLHHFQSARSPAFQASKAVAAASAPNRVVSPPAISPNDAPVSREIAEVTVMVV